MAGLIVHEWVEPTGGAERVVEQFMEQYPDSDLFVLWDDAPGRFPVGRTHESWLASTPLRRHKALALPFMPETWRHVPLKGDYDWLLVSSHLFAHHVRAESQASELPKFSYVHTPARYIWEPSLDSRGAQLPVRLASAVLKPLDRSRAQESTAMVANSEFTRSRIQRVWHRDADVIYPPVDTERIVAGGQWSEHLSNDEAISLGSLPDVFLLGASRFVPYKRLDLVIQAGEATGLPVVLAGRGPGEGDLRARAAESKVPVHFLISPSDALLYALYQQSLALVFPAIEDFGIMPVEAMAAGTPVIVPTLGGAAESARLVKGGVALSGFSTEEWRQAIDGAQAVDRAGLPERAGRFSCGRFREEVAQWLASYLGTVSTHQRRGGTR